MNIIDIATLPPAAQTVFTQWRQVDEAVLLIQNGQPVFSLYPNKQNNGQILLEWIKNPPLDMPYDELIAMRDEGRSGV